MSCIIRANIILILYTICTKYNLEDQNEICMSYDTFSCYTFITFSVFIES